MKRLFTLLATLSIAASLSAQERVIREFYTNTDTNSTNVAEEASVKKQRQARAEKPRQVKITMVNQAVNPDHRQGASPTVVEGSLFFDGLFSDDEATSISTEYLFHKRLYVIDNVYVSAGAGVLWNNTSLSSDISSWGLAGELPLMAGVNLFSDWVELQAGPSFAYTMFGGATIGDEKFSLRDLDTKRSSLSLDIRLSLGGWLGVKFRLNDEQEAIGITFAF